MRHVVIMIMAVLLMGGVAFADTPKDNDAPNTGVMVDVPNIVKITNDWSVGVEGGKDLWFAEGHGFKSYDANESWFGYVKVTYTGTLFDFSK